MIKDTIIITLVLINFFISLPHYNIVVKHNGLNHLYFRKGIAEYLLGYNDYKDSLEKAVNFSEMLGQYNIKNMLIVNCKKFYDIDI
jgi:hypothetical protein